MNRRKPLRWADALKKIFSPARSKQDSPQLAVEQLDDRIVPTLTLTASPGAPDTPFGSGNFGSLRYCIQVANASSDNDVIIKLTTGGLYNLTRPNSLLQIGEHESFNQVGDLNLYDSGRVAGIKTI